MTYTDDELNVLARTAYVGETYATDLGTIVDLSGLPIDKVAEAMKCWIKMDLIIFYESEDVLTENSEMTINEDNLPITRKILKEAGMWPATKTGIRRTVSVKGARNATPYVNQVTYTADEARTAHQRVDDAVDAAQITSISGRAYKAHITRRIAA